MLDSQSMYSHSKLSTFEQCPLRYRFRYIDGIKMEQKESVEAFLGIRVHESLEKLYKDLMHAKTMSLDELISFFDTNWDLTWTSDIYINNPDYGREQYREMGRRFLQDYYRRNHPFQDSRTLGLEMKFQIVIDGVNLIGFIDRLAMKEDGHLQIHDYKTGNRLLTQEEADNDRQLALYAIAVKEMYPQAKEVSLVWHFLAFDIVVISSRTPEELQCLRESIVELVKKIDSTHEFHPCRSALCSWCEFQSLCPEFKHAFDIQQDDPGYSPNEGTEMVDRYVTLKEKIKECQDRYVAEIESLEQGIIRFSQQYGCTNVFGTRHQIKVNSREAFKFPRKNSNEQLDLIGHLKKEGCWDRFATLDNQALQETLEAEPDFRSRLEADMPGAISSENRFGIRVSKRKDVKEDDGQD